MSRTIARGEIDETSGCVVTEPTRDKITAALAVAPTAVATNETKRTCRWPHSEWKLFDRIINLVSQPLSDVSAPSLDEKWQNAYSHALAAASIPACI
jgi:hypothetical protein